MIKQIMVDLSKWTDDRKYTKGMCYTLCEFLERLLSTQQVAIACVADELGYDSYIDMMYSVYGYTHTPNEMQTFIDNTYSSLAS